MSHSSPAFIGSRRLVKAVAARDRSDFSASCAFTHVSMCLWSGAANGSSRIVAVHRAVRAATAAPPDRRAAAAKAKLLSSRIRLRPVSRGGDGQIERIDIGDIAPIRYEDRNEDGIVIASRSFSIQFSINGRIPI